MCGTGESETKGEAGKAGLASLLLAPAVQASVYFDIVNLGTLGGTETCAPAHIILCVVRHG